MEALLEELGQLLGNLWDVLTVALGLLLPMLPLVAWIGFWLFAVNWKQFRSVLWSGGIVGVVLIGLVMILVWGTIAPPESGQHHLLFLTVGNFVGKTIFVTTLFCIMFLCGAVQLSGTLCSCCQFEEDDKSESQPAHH